MSKVLALSINVSVLRRIIRYLYEQKNSLNRYFCGDQIDLNALPLDIAGSTFQHQVWQIVRGIGYGKHLTYGLVAHLLGDTRCVRAVAQAIGRNPVSLFIPCHRVLGKGGKLTGFIGGLQVKQSLLLLEQGQTAFEYL